MYSASEHLIGDWGLKKREFPMPLDKALLMVHPADHKAVVETVEKAIATATPYYYIFRALPPGRGLRWVEVRGRPHFRSGQLVSFTGTNMDVTRRVEEAEERERERQAFASLVAHDLKNPIAVISMMAQLHLKKAQLAGTTTAPVPIEDLERLLRGTQQLNRLAGDMLDLSRVETGQISLKKEDVDLRAELEKLTADLGATVGKHNVIFTAHGDYFRARLDPARLREIITNLVDNAAKYSPDLTPIELSLTKSSAGLEITVKDQGMGIPADKLPMIFTKFYRTAEARETKDGVGLGLYITKTLVEGHGGRIWVESEKGQGTTFHILFPARHRGFWESLIA